MSEPFLVMAAKKAAMVSAKCVLRQSTFLLLDALLPGTGTVLRAIDKGIRIISVSSDIYNPVDYLDDLNEIYLLS